MDFLFKTMTLPNGLTILRDDFLPGGTKRRALNILLEQTSQTNIGYAGTIMGYGALALTHACNDTGKRANIFLSCPDNSNSMLHTLKNAGAIVHLTGPSPINQIHEEAERWHEEHDNSMVFPPGFNTPEFQTAMADALKDFDANPYTEIWTVSVSGTLTRALKHALPNKTFKTVSVVKSASSNDDYSAPEKYHQPARLPPPYPSCSHTDAKLWQFALKYAAPGALIWNTAG